MVSVHVPEILTFQCFSSVNLSANIAVLNLHHSEVFASSKESACSAARCIFSMRLDDHGPVMAALQYIGSYIIHVHVHVYDMKI